MPQSLIHPEALAAVGYDNAKPYDAVQFCNQPVLAARVVLYLGLVWPSCRTVSQIMLACLKKGLASWSGGERYGQRSFGEHAGFGFSEDLAEGSGFLPGIAFHATHEQVEAVLAEEVETFYKVAGGK